MRLARIYKIQAGLLGLALFFLLAVAGSAVIMAQDGQAGHYYRLEDKISNMGNENQKSQLDFEKRMAKLEAMAELNHRIMVAVVGALAIQMAETLWGIVVASKRRRAE